MEKLYVIVVQDTEDDTMDYLRTGRSDKVFATTKTGVAKAQLKRAEGDTTLGKDHYKYTLMEIDPIKGTADIDMGNLL